MRVNINDTQLFFDVEGASLVPDGSTLRERPVVVALHGGPGFDHAYFKPFLSSLADIAQIVYLDLRCQGRSGRPPVDTCTLEQMADDVAAFCATLGLDRPTILGHSAGGFVALALTARHPDVVGRLILVDTAAGISALEGNMEILEQRRGSEARQVAERLFAGDTSPAVLDDFLRLVMPAYIGDPTTAGAVFESLGRSSFNPEVSTFWSRQCAPYFDLRGRLRKIGVPTLVVVGDQDWITPPSASQALADGIPGAELVTFPGVGHFTFAERPAEFAELVCRFLAAPVPVGVGGI